MGFNNKTELKMLIKKLKRKNGSDIGFSIYEDEKGLQLFCDVPLSELEMPTEYSINGNKVYKNGKEISKFEVKTVGLGSQSKSVDVDNDLFKDDEEDKKKQELIKEYNELVNDIANISLDLEGKINFLNNDYKASFENQKSKLNDIKDGKHGELSESIITDLENIKASIENYRATANREKERIEKEQAASEQSNDTKKQPSFRNVFSRINNAKQEDKTSEKELEAARKEYISEQESAEKVYNELKELEKYVDDKDKSKYNDLIEQYNSGIINPDDSTKEKLKSNKDKLSGFRASANSLSFSLKINRYSVLLDKTKSIHEEFKNLNMYYNQKEVGLSADYSDNLENFQRSFDRDKGHSATFNYDKLLEFYNKVLKSVNTINNRNRKIEQENEEQEKKSKLIEKYDEKVKLINEQIKEIDKFNIIDDFSVKYGSLLSKMEKENLEKAKKYNYEKDFSEYSSSQIDFTIEEVSNIWISLQMILNVLKETKPKKDIIIKIDDAIKKIDNITTSNNSEKFLTEAELEIYNNFKKKFGFLSLDYRNKSILSFNEIYNKISNLLEKAKTNKDNYEKELKEKIQALNNKDAEDKAKLEEENKKIIEEIESSEDIIKDIMRITGYSNEGKFLTETEFEEVLEKQGKLAKKKNEIYDTTLSSVTEIKDKLNKLLETAKDNKKNYESIRNEIASAIGLITSINKKFLSEEEAKEFKELDSEVLKYDTKAVNYDENTIKSLTRIKNRLNELLEIANTNEKNQSEKAVVQEDPKVDDISKTNKKVVLASMLVSDLKQVLEQKENKIISNLLPEEAKVEDERTKMVNEYYRNKLILDSYTVDDIPSLRSDIEKEESNRKDNKELLEKYNQELKDLYIIMKYPEGLTEEDIQIQIDYKISQIKAVEDTIKRINSTIKIINMKISIIEEDVRLKEQYKMEAKAEETAMEISKKAAEAYHQEQIEFWNSLSDDDLSPLNKLDDDAIKQFIKEYMAKLEASRKAQEDLENFASSYNINNSSDNLKNYSKVYKN